VPAPEDATASTGRAQSAPSVFLTGANGFIARALADGYRAGGAVVRGVDVAADADRDVVAGDVSRPGAWQEHADGCELFVHTAAIVSMRRHDRERIWQVNAAGTRHALDAAARGGARRFLHLSSIVVFGFDFEGTVDERTPVRPNGVPYVDTKIASEQAVLAAHAAGEVACTVVRPGDVYGPGSRPWTVIPVDEIKARRMVLPAGGRGLLAPVYIDDLVEGLRLAASAPAGEGQVFTLTGGTAMTARDFFAGYVRMLGAREPRLAPRSVAMVAATAIDAVSRVTRRENEINRAAVAYLTRTGTYSIEKARSVLGYSPAVSLDDGMARTEEWLRAMEMLQPG
jgi:nucleoside-diphosphate-sugar epimerase